MAHYSKEVFEIAPGRYGYRVLRDGVPFILQEWKPGVSGFRTMTQQGAERRAQRLVEYYRVLDSVQTVEEANRVGSEFVRTEVED